ncbi:hypothetical protein FGB62_275g01 [Gracilaria domingensis]|nr:hypothetical protein FGB62_275g01 [Gracilaria domingensis]
MTTVRRNLEFVVPKCGSEESSKSITANGQYMNARQDRRQTAVDILRSELDRAFRDEIFDSNTETNDLPFFRVLVNMMGRQGLEEYADVLSTSYLDAFPSETSDEDKIDLQVSVLCYLAAISTEEKERTYGVWTTPR